MRFVGAKTVCRGHRVGERPVSHVLQNDQIRGKPDEFVETREEACVPRNGNLSCLELRRGSGLRYGGPRLRKTTEGRV